MDKLEEEFAEAISGKITSAYLMCKDGRGNEAAEMLAVDCAAIARKQVEEAIVPFERAESECPFSKSRTPSSNVPCPRCAATSNEGCRLQTIAAYDAVNALRAALHRKGVEPK